MKTLQFEVAGIKFHKADYRAAHPVRGDRLTLVLEPGNLYDPEAVKIMKGERHLGYVPRAHNKDRELQAALRERPRAVECSVDASWDNGCWVTVNIKEPNEHENEEGTGRGTELDRQAEGGCSGTK